MKKEPRKLEEFCASTTCAYRGHGVCDYLEGMYCPMFVLKVPSDGGVSQPKPENNGN